MSLIALASPAPEPRMLPLTELELPQYAIPTWEQAFEISRLEIEVGHETIHQLAGRLLPPRWAFWVELLGMAAFDGLVQLLPGGGGWLHEEGHRAVLATHGIESLNAFDFGSPCNPRAVCGVADEDLAAMKRDHPTDWIRLQAAGLEAELEHARRLEKSAFFAGRPGHENLGVLWIQKLAAIGYLSVCLSPALLTEREVLAEGDDELRRDFTGTDCTAWVYDLHRPREPYEARGLHPTGVGLRRFRLPSDLSTEERAYLGAVRNVSLLGLIDPHLFGFSSFDGTHPLNGQPLRWSASLLHQLTSFGDVIDANVLLAQGAWKVSLVYHLYRNGMIWLPGITAELYRAPLVSPLSVTLSVSGWLQPERQSFTSAAPVAGGAMGVQVGYPIFTQTELFLRLDAKTAGWRSGDPSLDAALRFGAGLSLLL